MNLFEYLETIPMTRALGWTLVHFVWQGALLALLVKVLLHLLKNRSANGRYLVCCIGMALMMAVPAATLLVIARTASDPIAAEISGLLSADLQSLPLWTRLSTVLPVMTLFWLAGTLLFQGRLFMHWSNAQRIKVRGTQPAPEEWQRIVIDLCRKMNIHQPVRLLESSLARVPMMMGWLRPVILVPATVLTGLPSEHLRMVIAHELAHVRRYDYIVNLVQAVFESLLFYHPAVWWLSNRLRVEREYCCDDVVVRMGRDALCYARALSLLDAMRGEECRTAPASTGGLLMNRIFRIAGVPSNRTSRLGGWLTLLVILLSLSAALSAMGLSPITAAAGEKPSNADAINKAYYVPFGYACEVEALVQKLKAKGLSDKEIEQALKKMQFQEQQSKEEAMKKAKMDALKREKEEQAFIKELKAKGLSDKEIKTLLFEKRMRAKTSGAMKKKKAAR